MTLALNAKAWLPVEMVKMESGRPQIKAADEGIDKQYKIS